VAQDLTSCAVPLSACRAAAADSQGMPECSSNSLAIARCARHLCGTASLHAGPAYPSPGSPRCRGILLQRRLAFAERDGVSFTRGTPQSSGNWLPNSVRQLSSAPRASPRPALVIALRARAWPMRTASWARRSSSPLSASRTSAPEPPGSSHGALSRWPISSKNPYARAFLVRLKRHISRHW